MKVTGKVLAVKVVKYATIYIQAESALKGLRYAEEHLDEICDGMWNNLEEQFEDSDFGVLSADSYLLSPSEYMKDIWVDGEAMSYDDYVYAVDDSLKD